MLHAYERIFEVIPDAVLLVDRAGRIVLANAKGVQLFGYRLDELTDHTVELLIPPRLAERHVAHRAQYAAAASARAMSARLDLLARRKDGSEFPVDIMLGPLDTSAGMMTLCVVRDATERKRAEDALRASEARFRMLVEEANDGIFIATADGRYVDVNPAGCEMVGYTYDEIVNMTIAHLVPADEVPRIAPELARLGAGQRVRSEWRFRRKDGSIFFGEVNVRQLPDSRVFAILRDISVRKAAEEALRLSEARLAEAQQLAQIGSWEFDLRTDVLVWSAQTYRIFEVDPAAFGGTYAAFLAVVHPDDRARVNEAYHRSLASGLPYEIEHRIVMKDGRIKHVTERCMTYCDADGQPLRSIGTVQDITERRRMEQALRAQETAEAASRAKTEFLAHISHELRTPLNAVLGFSQLLLMQTKDRLSEQQAKWANNIVEAGRHITQLIGDLLDISRIEMGEVEIESAQVDLTALLDEALLMMNPQAERSKIAVSADYRGAEPIQVRADPTRLRQVVLNLLSNAIKYNREGGSVRIGAQRVDGRAQIEVADTGLGMTREQIERLFVPFDRLGREKSQVEGVGIGLALSRRLVQMMDGTIDVLSEPGRGTSMRISLPCWAPEPGAAA